MVRKDVGPRRCSEYLNCNNGVNSGGVILLVEIVSEGPHCVPCEYAIAAVEYVSESYVGRIEVRVLETKLPADALRYLELSEKHGGCLPVPAILFDGRLVFDQIPGPEELCEALNNALRDKGEEL
ncbi:MAG: thioredoxin-like (seleno)protein [Desulfomonilaceae bacterium]